MADQLPPDLDLCAIPSGPPPPGVVPNLVDPVNLRSSIIAVSAVMTAWSAIFTFARLYNNKDKLKWADLLCSIAFVLSTGYTAAVLIMVKYARHQWDTPACWFTGEYMKILFAQGMLLGPAIFFSKAAIFSLFLQLFATGAFSAQRIAIYIGLVITFVVYWVHIPLEAYYAGPHIGETWEDLLVNKRPEKMIYWGAVQGAFSVFLDVYIFILPLPTLSKLQMSTRKRIALLGVFMTALMGIICSVLCLVYRIKLNYTKDVAWTQSCLFICIIVENNVAVIVSSMPAVATFMKVHVSNTGFARSLMSRLNTTRRTEPTTPSFVQRGSKGSGSCQATNPPTIGSASVVDKSAAALAEERHCQLYYHHGNYYQMEDIEEGKGRRESIDSIAVEKCQQQRQHNLQQNNNAGSCSQLEITRTVDIDQSSLRDPRSMV